MDDRLANIEHNGKTVLLSDFSGLIGQELIEQMHKAQERDTTAPNGSLMLTDISGCHINKEIGELAVAMGKEADRRGFKQAIVGVTGIQKVIFMAFKRSVHLARDRQDALDWLTRDESQ